VTRNERDKQQEFVRDVLARTSGSACGRALEQLPALHDGELVDLDRSLVRQHLEHCGPCRAVAVTLGWLGDELTSLAELDPGEAFTRAVIARTSAESEPARARRHARVAESGPAGLMDRLGRWWGERILAPNFAVHVAYAATVLLVLIFTLPISPLKETPGRMLEAVQAGPAHLPLVGPAAIWTADRAAVGVATLRGGIDARWQAVADDWRARVDRSAADRAATADHLAAAFRRAGDRQTGNMTVELSGALSAGKAAWRAWWYTEPDSDSTSGR
jgi:hypothetical protein